MHVAVAIPDIPCSRPDSPGRRFSFPLSLMRGQRSSATCATESSFGYPGWRVAVVCHIGVLTSFATVFIYSFSFMVKPLQHEFGWNSEQVAVAFSLAAISLAICSPFMGRLFDRIEPRKLVAAMMAALLACGKAADHTCRVGHNTTATLEASQYSLYMGESQNAVW